MNTNNVLRFIKTVQKGLIKHGPEILTGAGIVGSVATTILAVKATPAAMKCIENAEEEKGDKLTKVETVKAAWKPYIPAIVTGTMSIGCLVGASNANARRNAALMSAYQISTAALSEYKDTVVETIGEEKAKEVRDKIVEKKADKSKADKPTTVIIGMDDDVIFKEPFTNIEFRSTKNKLDSIQNDLNGRMIDGMEMYMSLNELLDEFGLDHHPIGDDIGWTVHDRIDYTYELGETKSGKPCFEIAYLQPPFHDFRKLL